MSRDTRVTISLPAELVQRMDRLRACRGKTRSDLIREAIERVLRDQQERQDIERYVRGYQASPATPEESASLDELAGELATRGPWE